MDRLTAQWGKNHAVPTKFDLDDFALKLENPEWDGFTKILDRLAAYEDTGLEPDEIPHWIDAESETPDIGQTVLAYLPDKEEEKIRVGEYLGEGDYRIGRKVYRGYEIGAWMLLLQPPKEEKGC